MKRLALVLAIIITIIGIFDFNLAIDIIGHAIVVAILVYLFITISSKKPK